MSILEMQLQIMFARTIDNVFQKSSTKTCHFLET